MTHREGRVPWSRVTLLLASIIVARNGRALAHFLFSAVCVYIRSAVLVRSDHSARPIAQIFEAPWFIFSTKVPCRFGTILVDFCCVTARYMVSDSVDTRRSVSSLIDRFACSRHSHLVRPGYFTLIVDRCVLQIDTKVRSRQTSWNHEEITPEYLPWHLLSTVQWLHQDESLPQQQRYPSHMFFSAKFDNVIVQCNVVRNQFSYLMRTDAIEELNDGRTLQEQPAIANRFRSFSFRTEIKIPSFQCFYVVDRFSSGSKFSQRLMCSSESPDDAAYGFIEKIKCA